MMKLCIMLLISLVLATTHCYSQEVSQEENETEIDSQEASETELARQTQNPCRQSNQPSI